MGNSTTKRRTHMCYQATHPDYPQRAPVKSIFWNIPDPDYKPVDFTSPVVLEHDKSKVPGGWADPAVMTRELSFDISQRASHALKVGGKCKMVDGMPRNPIGRTGICGRGLLGKYGPNQAADALLTRYNDKGNLEMIAVKRGDNGQWAIPGGMVNEQEPARHAAIRELFEEALSKSESDKATNDKLKEFLSVGRAAVYIGYVDDPRNTDNAWMESTVFHFHIKDQALANSLVLAAGDDAVDAKWLEISDEQEDFKNLFASHRLFVICALAKHREQFKDTLLKVQM